MIGILKYICVWSIARSFFKGNFTGKMFKSQKERGKLAFKLLKKLVSIMNCYAKIHRKLGIITLRSSFHRFVDRNIVRRKRLHEWGECKVIDEQFGGYCCHLVEFGVKQSKACRLDTVVVGFANSKTRSTEKRPYTVWLACNYVHSCD